jgi:single-stranded-DNA-specific exonuclease
LESANVERRRIEEDILTAATEKLDGSFREEKDLGIVVGGDGWHAGVIGIVASKLCERFRRPVAVVGFDARGRGRGSCRGIRGTDLVELLGGCADLLVSFGGHAMAAGLVVDRARFHEFRERFGGACAAKLAGTDLRPVHNVDAWLDLAGADRRLLEATRLMSPFGAGNPQPVWGVRGARFVGRPRIVGKGHLKAVVAGGGAQLDAIGFGMGDRQIPDGAVDILFQLQEDTYMGRDALQLKLKDFRPAGE